MPLRLWPLFCGCLVLLALGGWWLPQQRARLQDDQQLSASSAARDADAIVAPRGSTAVFAGAPLVAVTLSNSAYKDWALNWAAHLSAVRLPHLVVALDAPAAACLFMHGVAFVDASAEAAAAGVEASNMRTEFAAFRAAAHLKVAVPLRLLRRYGWGAVLIGDADVAWRRHPGVLLDAWPAADVLASTDCLSHAAMAAGRGDVPRCGTLPRSTQLSAWNTGAVLLRNTSAGMAFGDAWAGALAPDAPSHDAAGWWVDDQLSFTQLMDDGSLPFEAAPEVQSSAPRISAADDAVLLASIVKPVLAWRKRVAVVGLPPLVVAGGHVALQQRLPERLGLEPWALHPTFQENGGDAGKRARMREARAWLLEPSAAFAGRRWLTYDNSAAAYVDAVAGLWRADTGRPLARLQAQLVGAAYQLQVFAEVLAAAAVLQRVLVPPRFVCWCYQDSSVAVDMLHDCVAPGVDAPPPYECPAEMLLMNAEALLAHYNSDMRPPGFLQHARLAADAADTVRVRVVLDWQPPDGEATAAAAAGRPVLPLAASERQLLASAGAVSAAVLHLGRPAPRWLRGLSAPEATARVQASVDELVGDAGWCCLLTASGDAPGTPAQDLSHALAGYTRPVLAVHADDDGGPSSSWAPPDDVFAAPAWCTSPGGLSPFNLNVSRRANHPCSYSAGLAAVSTGLRTGLAAALADAHARRLDGGGADVAAQTQVLR